MTAIIETTKTEYDAETGETFYGIYAKEPIEVEMFNEVIVELKTELLFYKLNRNDAVERKCRVTDRNVNKRIMNVFITQYLEDEFVKEFGIEKEPSTTFDAVITQLKNYTQKSNIFFYHRITMVDIVREVKNREVGIGRAVNKKSGIECEYNHKRQVELIRRQLPELRRTTYKEEMDFKITLYPILKNITYIGPTTLRPIIFTIGDVLKGTTPFNLPNLIEYDYTQYYYKNGCRIKGIEHTENRRLSLEYKITIERGDFEDRPLHIVETPLISYATYQLIYDGVLPSLMHYIYIPTPYSIYKRVRHQNRLLTLLLRIKRWDCKGNALLTGCKAQQYKNDWVIAKEWDFKHYTTKDKLVRFITNCGYIQNKLHTEGNPITQKAIDKENKIIGKKSYKDLSLWIYKQY